MIQEENFHQMLRDIIPQIQEARINVLKAEANLKKVFWIQLCTAKDDGERSYNAQKSKAEASEDYYTASMNVATAKASLDALQTEKSAIDMQFEEWRTKMANLRMERSRYGA
jgi:multidrug resistance efflux pump